MPYTIAYNRQPPKYYTLFSSATFTREIYAPYGVEGAPPPTTTTLTNANSRDSGGNEWQTYGGAKLTWTTITAIETGTYRVGGGRSSSYQTTVVKNTNFNYVADDATYYYSNSISTATFSGQEDTTITTSFSTWQRRTTATTAATWLLTTAVGGSSIPSFSSVRKINESQWLGNTYSTRVATITGLSTRTQSGVALTTKSAALYNYGEVDYYVYCFPGESFLIPSGNGIKQYTTATSYDVKYASYATGVGGPYWMITTTSNNPFITAIDGNTTTRSILASAGLGEFPPAVSTIPFATYTSRLDTEYDWEGSPMTSKETLIQGGTESMEWFALARLQTQSGISIDFAGDYSFTKKIDLPSPATTSGREARGYGLGYFVMGGGGMAVFDFPPGVTVLSRDIDGMHFALPRKSGFTSIEPAQAMRFQNSNIRYKDAPIAVSASPNVVMYMPADTSLRFSVVNGSPVQESAITTAKVSHTEGGFAITTVSMVNSNSTMSQIWNHGMTTSGAAFYSIGNNAYAEAAGTMGIAAWSPRAKGPLTVLLSPGIYKIVTDSGSSTASAMTTLSSQSSRTISAIRGVNTIYYAYSAGASFSTAGAALAGIAFGDMGGTPNLIGVNYGQFF
jgi:hypothetical protein